MIDLQYSLVIEATDDPTFFCFYSPDLHGFTGVGHSIEDCVYQAKPAMDEFLDFMREQGDPIPRPSRRPYINVVNARKGGYGMQMQPLEAARCEGDNPGD